MEGDTTHVGGVNQREGEGSASGEKTTMGISPRRREGKNVCVSLSAAAAKIHLETYYTVVPSVRELPSYNVNEKQQCAELGRVTVDNRVFPTLNNNDDIVHCDSCVWVRAVVFNKAGFFPEIFPLYTAVKRQQCLSLCTNGPFCER